jgi:quinol monooxygenase YgiN
MSRIGVLIHFVAKPGQRDALAAHLLQAASGYAAEQGTELFTISLSPGHDDEVVVFETYRDEAAKRAHESALAMPRYAPRQASFLAARRESSHFCRWAAKACRGC